VHAGVHGVISRAFYTPWLNDYRMTRTDADAVAKSADAAMKIVAQPHHFSRTSSEAVVSSTANVVAC